MREVVKQILTLEDEASHARVKVHEKYSRLAEQLAQEPGMNAVIRVQYSAMTEKIYICTDEFDSRMAGILDSYDLEWDVVKGRETLYMVRCWHPITLTLED